MTMPHDSDDEPNIAHLSVASRELHHSPCRQRRFAEADAFVMRQTARGKLSSEIERKRVGNLSEDLYSLVEPPPFFFFFSQQPMNKHRPSYAEIERPDILGLNGGFV